MVLPITNPTKSFWIEAAESPLRDHRTTPDLPDQVDVVIIGSGYTGATMAYWLAKYSKAPEMPNILILEARDICGGATGRNGGQLRPHYYSRYPLWRARFGADTTRKLIEHEAAHLDVFTKLIEEEGLAEETLFNMDETFDAAMHQEAWDRLSNALDELREDHPDAEITKACRKIEDPVEAEAFTQMKGCIGAIVHPAGQIWPYKFVHALLRKVLGTGLVNLQANTPVESVSGRDAAGQITVSTPRGQVRARAVVHATNRWASHLLPTFSNLIYAGRGTLAAIKAPDNWLHHTGAQHWDGVVNNYFLELPPPYSTIICGGAKALTVHKPEQFINNDQEDIQFHGVPDFYHSWPANDLKDWPTSETKTDFSLEEHQGGVWSGIYGTSIDSFPFIGALPGRDGHFVAAGYSGHGMPRILGSTAHLAPIILDSLSMAYTKPALAKIFPPLPAPFHLTTERLEALKDKQVDEHARAGIEESLASAKKEFCSKYASV